MTGPEHYAEAERLLAASSGPNASTEWIAACQGAAQVHATLALAAATAENDAECGKSSEQCTAWGRVIA